MAERRSKCSGQTDKEKDGRIDEHAKDGRALSQSVRQTHRQTDRQTGGQTDEHSDALCDETKVENVLKHRAQCEKPW